MNDIATRARIAFWPTRSGHALRSSRSPRATQTRFQQGRPVDLGIGAGRSGRPAIGDHRLAGGAAVEAQINDAIRWQIDEGEFEPALPVRGFR